MITEMDSVINKSAAEISGNGIFCTTAAVTEMISKQKTLKTNKNVMFLSVFSVFFIPYSLLRKSYFCQKTSKPDISDQIITG